MLYCRYPSVCSKALFRECAIVFFCYKNVAECGDGKAFSWSLCTHCVILMLWVLFSCALFWTSLEVLNSFALSSRSLQPKAILLLCLHYVSKCIAELYTETRPYQFTSFFCVTFYIYIVYKWWCYTLQIVLYIYLYRCLSGPILYTNRLVYVYLWICIPILYSWIHIMTIFKLPQVIVY